MVRRFAKYYKPHKKLFFIDMFCAVMMAGIDLVYPVAARRVINEYIPNKQIDSILMMAGVLVGLFLVRFICSYIVDSWGHIVGVRMESDMREEVFSHIQKLSVDFYDNNKTGHIMSRIVNDLKDITELAHHGPEDLIISVVMLLGSFGILMSIEWRLTLILFLFIPIMAIFGIRKRRRMSQAFRAQRKEIANINSGLENSISGVRVTKSFTGEDYELERFKENNGVFKSTREGAYKVMAEFTSGILLFSNTLDVIVISLGGYFAYKGIINTGDLIAYMLYIAYFLQPIKKLGLFMQHYQDGMSGFERFTELMDIEPSIVDRENAVEVESVSGEIEFRDVSFRYSEGKSDVLESISFRVESGKTMALVGPSGGGKSTICQLIMRFYDVDSGAILLDGRDIRDIKLKSLREKIGFVHQDVFLFTGTVKENIIYGKRDAKFEEIVEAAKNANIHEFIMTLPDGYDTNIGEKGVKLSGGQKQRISIARVFLKDPSILILDEATSALDNENEVIIQESLEKLSRGRTTIVIAHRLSTIKSADEIIVLTESGIAESGTHKELLERDGAYSRLYKSQFQKIS
ncbi:ABC transporter ATP-binding protein [Andreesenia angusta]|nr:ABC transporter ATP-binding protein [Andreesenia angusta]